MRSDAFALVKVLFNDYEGAQVSQQLTESTWIIEVAKVVDDFDVDSKQG